MKPERKIVAERVVAQHCAELVRTAPGPAELSARLNEAAARLARSLAPALAPLAGGKGLAVKPREARETSELEFSMLIPGLAANTLFGVGPEAQPLVVSVDAGAVLRMVDRTFGGRGTAPDKLPAEFPGSADLMIGRIEALLGLQLSAALDRPADAPLVALSRSGVLDDLRAFPGVDMLIMVELQVVEAGGDSWPITIAMPSETLAALFTGSPATAPQSRRAADPLAEPFSGVPLDLSAVLVDMRMSMKVLAALCPGALLPVAVARQVPLRIAGGDGPTLATGTVGAAEDRVALQITSAF
ncbi:MAG TPA: FliM/FliN family flagellar motor switch protein [Novosphingobium sp.]|nr:FliM/FliN family flagellar motor switch protein [Novosphingobium sp.]